MFFGITLFVFVRHGIPPIAFYPISNFCLFLEYPFSGNNGNY